MKKLVSSPEKNKPEEITQELEKLGFTTKVLRHVLIAGSASLSLVAVFTAMFYFVAHGSLNHIYVGTVPVKGTETQKQLEQARTSAPNLRQLKTVAMLLWPPTRGATRIPTLSLPEGTDLAVLTLAIESDEFSAYRAALKDPEANHVIWQSEDLESVPAGERRAISISFPASLLKAQNYIVELTVAPAKGQAKIVGAYPFRVVLK